MTIHRLLTPLERLLPRRLTTRIMLSMVAIVVLAGLITAVAVNQLVSHHLRSELIASGKALTLALGESIANALVEGDLVAMQEMVDVTVANNPDILYAFAFGPATPIVHTFPNGFPGELLHVVGHVDERPGTGILLATEFGVVRHFGYRPLDGLPAEVHIGFSQARILDLQRQVTGFVLMLTVFGCAAAVALTYGFSRLALHPLAELSRQVKRLGEGYLDERTAVLTDDEVGDLARAFNEMAERIQESIAQLRLSEAGYRDLLTAAAVVGEGIALICDEGAEEGHFLFVNEAFARMTGYTVAELIGSNAAQVLHPDSVATARRTWQAVKATQQPPDPVELSLVNRRGEKLVLETTITLTRYQGRQVLAWFMRDITQRKAQENELRRRNRELSALNAVASAMSEILSPPQMLERALEQVLQALDLTVGWVVTLEEDGSAQVAAWHGFDAPPTPDFPYCLCSAVAVEHRPLIVFGDDPRCVARQVLRRGGRPLCHATVAIQARGRVLGMLNVAAETPQVFTETEMALLGAVGQQIGVALENARLWEALRQREERRSELLAQVIRAQEEERRRIARELHDGIGQSINALVFGLNASALAIAQDASQAPRLLARLTASASDIVHELQNVIYDLRPSLLDDLGLVMALRWYAEERLRNRGIDPVFDLPEDTLRLPEEVETALFRIGQEAITNICRHAQATQAWIALAVTPDRVHLTIRDNGVGFDRDALKAASQKRRPWGLLGMQERAALLRGHFSIDSGPGKGTIVQVSLPLGAHEP
jgi:PAS domain S-box-containing protein